MEARGGNGELQGPADCGDSVIAPLPIEEEELVIVEIVEIVDGVADTSLVHLPAAVSKRGAFRFDSYDFPPATWPSSCRKIRSGAVYVRAGMLANATVCPDCEARL